MPLSTSDVAAPRHWVLPFAASLSDPCVHVLPHLDHAGRLPNLQTLLTQLEVSARSEGDEYALSMPHERVLAQQMAWPTFKDGQLPWAAWWAQQDGLQLPSEQPWGLMTPGHWLMGRDHFTLLDPATLALSEADSRTLLDAIRPLFEDDGWQILWGAPLRWYVSHPSLKDLPTATLERVIGRNPDVWLTDHRQARMLRRLQSEVQMLLYQHPLNEAREMQGLPTVNSFWLSGCGQTINSQALPASVQIIDNLRTPLLADDMPAWVAAWEDLDRTVLKDIVQALTQGEDIRLTLCGECHALTLSKANPSFTARVSQSLQRLFNRGQADLVSTFLKRL